MDKQSSKLMSIRTLLAIVVIILFIGTGLWLLDVLTSMLSGLENRAAGSLSNAAMFFAFGVFALAINHVIPVLLAIERNTWLALPEQTRKKLQKTASEQACDDQIFEYACEWPGGCSNRVKAMESVALKAGWAIIHEQAEGGIIRCAAYCPTHVQQGPECPAQA